MNRSDGTEISNGCVKIHRWRSGSKEVRARSGHFLGDICPIIDILQFVVSTADDVQLAIDYGVDGVVISNHGGRQLDGQPATLDALRECAPIAHGKIPLAIDGGIRRGSDLFKAIALGASICFAGRIPIWGLAVGSLPSHSL